MRSDILDSRRGPRAGLVRKWLPCAYLATALLVSPTSAAENANAPKGLWLTTDYPSLMLRAGEETTLNLTLHNYGLPPQRTELTLDQKPADWTATIEGQGKPVGAAFVDHNGRASLSLKLKIPAEYEPGTYKLTLNAVGPDARSELPINVRLEPPLEAKLTADPKLPVLRGSPRSTFDFRVSLKNESAGDMLAQLAAQAPRGWQVTFKEGYGSQELTSLPIKAGETKDLSVSVKPTQDTSAGQYNVIVRVAADKAQADARLTLDVSGQPTVSIAGEGERLSGSAFAGEEKPVKFVLRNTGTAPARNVELNASPPSGWKVSFEPKSVDLLAPGEEREVTALIKPADKAINGDYVMSVRASGDGVSESASYRVTVMTSTLWGVTGVGVIAAAMLVLVGAVGRFGRR